MSTDFHSEILTQLDSLGPELQRRVLQYVRSLKRGDTGTPGSVVADFVGTIPAEDLSLIQTAIENGCEQVDLNEW